MPFVDPHSDLRSDPAVAARGVVSVLIDGRAHAVAPVRSRLIAGLIDLVAYRALTSILFILWMAYAILYSIGHDYLDHAPLPIAAAYYVGTVVYFGLIPWRDRGQTVGKRFMGLRVVGEDGSELTQRQSLIRDGLFRAGPLLVLPIHAAPSIFDLGLLAFGAVILLATRQGDPHHRTIYDRAAGTIVICDDPIPLKAGVSAVGQGEDPLEPPLREAYVPPPTAPRWDDAGH